METPARRVPLPAWLQQQFDEMQRRCQRQDFVMEQQRQRIEGLEAKIAEGAPTSTQIGTTP